MARPYRDAARRPFIPSAVVEASPRRIIGGASAAISAGVVGLAFVIGRVLGLLREMLMAYRFGAGPEMDAYVAAFRLPDLLFLGVMSVAFGAAFIPVFGGYLTKGDEDRAWRLASAVVVVALLVTVALCAIAFALADPLMRQLIAPGLEGEALQTAIRTMRLLLLSPILIGLGIAVKGMLEAQDIFAPSAFAPVFYNLATIGGVIFFAPSLGVRGVALGAVIGAGLHVLVQLPSLARSGARFMFDRLPTRVDGFREVMRLLAPRVVGQAAFQINFIWISSLATTSGPGEASGLNFSWQMLMLPHGLIALSISTVIFPRMARQFELGQLDEVRGTFTEALRPLLYLMIPASLGLFLFRSIIVRALFENGAFDASDTALVASAVGFLGLGLVWYGAVEITTRIFYAMRDTRTPVIAGVLIIVINMIVAWFLVDDYGAGGLAISLSVSTGIEAFILMAVLRRRIGGFGNELAGWLGRVLMACLAMVLAAEAVVPRVEAATAFTGQAGAMAMTAYAVATIGGVYFVTTWLLDVPEANRFVGIASRFGGKIPVLRGVLARLA